MGSPRVRAVTVAALVLFLGAVLMPYLFRLLLPLPEWLYEALLLSYLGGATLVTLVVGAVSWVALWPATPYLDLRPGEPEPQGADPREAKEALQAFPGRLALAGIAAGELLTATGWLALLFAGLPLALVLSLSLTTAVVVALLWMLLHALGQSAVEPHLLRLREVPVPLSSEAGTAVAARTGATLLLIVLSGTVPAAVFANAFVERQQDQHARDHAERCARWLSIATRGLSPLLAQRLVDTANLSQGLPTTILEEARQPRPSSLRAAARPPATPWGRALSATEADADVPASVMLPGGQRLYLPLYDTRDPSDGRPLPLLLGLFAVLVLGIVAALVLARLVEADVLALLRRVKGLSTARSSDGGRGRAAAAREVVPRFRETDQVAAALERLLDRVRRLHVASYLSVERTVDARRAKSQFLASMSHDLRGPLTSVLGFSELLTGGFEGEIPDAVRRRLVLIHRTGRRLLRLLSEILDTAKVESQTIELHLKRCAPAELLLQAVAEARRGRLYEDVPLVVDAAPGLSSVSVDPLRFPQALAHLINHVLDCVSPERPDAPLPDELRDSRRTGAGALRALSERSGRTPRPRSGQSQTLRSAQSPTPEPRPSPHGIIRISAREGQLSVPTRPGAINENDSGTFLSRLRRSSLGTDSGHFPSFLGIAAPPGLNSGDNPATQSSELTASQQGPTTMVMMPSLEVLVEHVRAPSESAASPSASRDPTPINLQSTLLVGAAGLGLALPLARRLVALHGGHIEVMTGTSLGLRAVIPQRPGSPP